MQGARVVTIPADEFEARPAIVAWLAYPSNDRFRDRAIEAIADWARWRVRRPLVGRKARVESTLVQLAKEVERSLLAGEIFRRQLIDREAPSIFGPSSTRQFARRVADWREVAQSTTIRDFWSKRRPVLALAAGACAGLSQRPDLADLLFGEREWASRALTEAESMRSLALSVGHDAAEHLHRFGPVDAARPVFDIR